MKRMCVLIFECSNRIEPDTEPKAKILEYTGEKDKTTTVLNYLIKELNWTTLQLNTWHDHVRVIDMDDETDELSIEPMERVDTIALFTDENYPEFWAFKGIVKVKEGETIKKALIEKSLGSEDWTFDIPQALEAYTTAQRTWPGFPIAASTTGQISITHKIVGFVMPLDEELSKALEVIDIPAVLKSLIDLIKSPANDSVCVLVRLRELFSSYMQSLCEDHSLVAPMYCELE